MARPEMKSRMKRAEIKSRMKRAASTWAGYTALASASAAVVVASLRFSGAPDWAWKAAAILCVAPALLWLAGSLMIGAGMALGAMWIILDRLRDGD